MTRLSDDRLSKFRLSSTSEASTVNDAVWRFNGTEAVSVIDELRTWRELELTFRAEDQDMDSVFHEMDVAAGTYDVVEVTGGSYTVVERGAEIVTLEAPENRRNLRSTTEYVIDEYEENLQNQEEGIYEVTITAVATSPKDSGNHERVSRIPGQWHLSLADGDIQTNRVKRTLERGGTTFDGSFDMEVMLRAGEAQVLEESLNRQAAVRKQTVPDGQDKFRDENENGRNTVTVTPPEGHSTIPEGDYAVESWESKWVNDLFYRYHISFGYTAEAGSVSAERPYNPGWEEQHYEVWSMTVNGYTLYHVEPWGLKRDVGWTLRHTEGWSVDASTVDWSQQHVESWVDDSGPTVVEDFGDQSLSAYTTTTGLSHHWQVTDADSGQPLGGGWAYYDKVYESDADVKVSSWSELESELNGASYGDVIYITDDIEMPTDPAQNIPSGVTLAGDRGIDGSPGPLVEHPNATTDGEITGFSIDDNEGGDQRLTGFRFKGPNMTWSESSDTHGWDSEWGSYGLRVGGGNDGIRIDNMEVYAWGQACLGLGGNEATVEYNHIHRGTRDGQGYGVSGDGAHLLVRYNTFAKCRHMVSLEGDFELDDNIAHPPHAGNVFDSHPSADRADVKRNTIIAAYHQDLGGEYGTPSWANGTDYGNGTVTAGYIHRETPDTLVEAWDNWTFNYEPPSADEWHASLCQQHVSSFTNMDVQSNTIGHDAEPPDEDMAPDGRVLRPESTAALVAYDDHRSIQIQARSGLPVEPSAGDTLRYWFMVTDPTLAWETAFLFGVQDETATEGYYELQKQEGDLRLQRDDVGTSTDTDLGSTSVDWLPHVPYRIDVGWPSDPSANGMEVTIAEHLTDTTVGSFTATADDTYTTGGIGFYSTSNPNIVYDDVLLI